MSERGEVLKGLEGVYVTESAISLISTERGALYYAGYDLRELVKDSSFEEVVFILLRQRLPSKKELQELTGHLRDLMRLEPIHIETIRRYVRHVDILTLLAVLMSLEGSQARGGDPNDISSAINVVAKMGAFFSTILRMKAGGDYVQPRTDLSYAENMLHMMNGGVYREEHIEILDDLLIIHADHGMSASTFACLVAASTLSDIYSAIASGILTLKGPLHGGASEASYEQALSIGSPEKVPEWMESVTAQRRRVMGFGHRVYKIYDPRAMVVKEIIAKFLDKTEGEVKRVYEIIKALEDYGQILLAPKGIYPNLDLWTPILYRLLGFPTDSFTAFFAVSRSAGWAAHVLEYWRDNRLIRPLHLYVGAEPRKYVPLELREDP